MDQLFVSERLPAASPQESSDIRIAVPEDSTASAPSHIGRGKGPEQSGNADSTNTPVSNFRDEAPSDGEQEDTRVERSKQKIDESQRQGQGDEGFLERYLSAYGHPRREALTRRDSPENRVEDSSDNSEITSPNVEASFRGNAAATSSLDLYGNNEDDGEIYRRPSPLAGDSSGQNTPSRGTATPRRYSRPVRPYSYAGGSNGNDLFTGRGPSHSSLQVSSQSIGRRSPQEVVVPRWQPDAEVTFCPICRTQFSFFVRKHHCRKCGRVVCNSCSPHRITIPHQYIVQPPTEQAAQESRPSVDSARQRSSTVVASLGGGERVRLCNPCVPDPNIAPPQTRSDGHPIQGHNRSASTVPYTQYRRDISVSTPRPRPRESSISTEARQSRYWAGNTPSGQPQVSSSLGQYSSPTGGLDVRSRSSTVGSTRDSSQITGRIGADTSTAYSQPYTHAPRSEADLSRPLPETPHPHQSTMRSQRRVIAEDDQCWICYRELPSRTLPNFEDLRAAHVASCIAAAEQGASNSSRSSRLPRGPAPVSSSAPRASFSYHQHPDPDILATAGSPSTSTTSPSVRPPPPPSSSSQPPPSTPESRMLARERQHAAIVLGQASASSSTSAMSRLIPYTASEKDGIDDAECMICMEEFEVGQQMGRLECFCRFHLKCITGWFEQKPGKCPVHGGDLF